MMNAVPGNGTLCNKPCPRKSSYNRHPFTAESVKYGMTRWLVCTHPTHNLCHSVNITERVSLLVLISQSAKQTVSNQGIRLSKSNLSLLLWMISISALWAFQITAGRLPIYNAGVMTGLNYSILWVSRVKQGRVLGLSWLVVGSR